MIEKFLNKTRQILTDLENSGLWKALAVWIKKHRKSIDALAKRLHKKNISAHMISLFGFVIGMMAVNFLAMNMYFEALLCILINRFCDILDGCVARIEGVSIFGQFLDLCLDFIFYAGVIFGFALAQPEDNAVAACFLLFGFMSSVVALLAYGTVHQGKPKVKEQEDSFARPFYLGGIVQGGELSVCLILLCLMPFAFLPVSIALGCWCLVKSVIVMTTAYYQFVILKRK